MVEKVGKGRTRRWLKMWLRTGQKDIQVGRKGQDRKWLMIVIYRWEQTGYNKVIKEWTRTGQKRIM
jgi:hypothetical protein